MKPFRISLLVVMALLAVQGLGLAIWLQVRSDPRPAAPAIPDHLSLIGPDQDYADRDMARFVSAWGRFLKYRLETPEPVVLRWNLDVYQRANRIANRSIEHTLYRIHSGETNVYVVIEEENHRVRFHWGTSDYTGCSAWIDTPGTNVQQTYGINVSAEGTSAVVAMVVGGTVLTNWPTDDNVEYWAGQNEWALALSVTVLPDDPTAGPRDVGTR